MSRSAFRFGLLPSRLAMLFHSIASSTEVANSPRAVMIGKTARKFESSLPGARLVEALQNSRLDTAAENQPNSEDKTAARSRRLFLFVEHVMTDLAALKQANARRWKQAKNTRDFALVAKRLVVVLFCFLVVVVWSGVSWFVFVVFFV